MHVFLSLLIFEHNLFSFEFLVNVFLLFRNTHLSVEKRTQDIPDDSTRTNCRPLSRIEDLIDKRKTNRGLTPTVTPTKRRSQS